jgi:hypothetical protein
MNPNANPFSPGAGTTPPELKGREKILERSSIIFSRIMLRKFERSLVFVGLRGVGKTVLLRKIEELAKNSGCSPVFIEANETKSLVSSIVTSLRDLLLELDKVKKANEKVKRSLRALCGFAAKIKIKYHDVELSLDMTPERGVADSGILEHDLSRLFEVVAEAALAEETAIVLFVDELQLVSQEELSALIMAIHYISQKNLPLIMIAAGLPYIIGRSGDAKSYAERLFDFLQIGALNDHDAAEALRNPVCALGADFTEDALVEIVKRTHGYPYFIQEWGYQSWNLAPSSPIDFDTVSKANDESIKKLDESFFRMRFDRLTKSEKKYLRILAELDPEDRTSSNVATRRGVQIRSLAPVRDSLIKKGMIYSPQHGKAEFTVPMFDRFMKRVMPKLEDIE